MEIYENLEIVDIMNDPEGVTFILLDPIQQEIHDVKWRKQAYDPTQNVYVDDEAKIAQVESWCDQLFGLELKDIDKAVGQRRTVYGYDTFDSFWEADVKFEKADKGKIFQTKVKDVKVTAEAIKISYEWKGKTYSSYKRFTQSFGNTYYINPQKRNKQKKWFKDTFGVDIKNCAEVIGRDIIVEVKCAFGSKYYGDIKPGMD